MIKFKGKIPRYMLRDLHCNSQKKTQRLIGGMMCVIAVVVVVLEIILRILQLASELETLIPTSVLLFIVGVTIYSLPVRCPYPGLFSDEESILVINKIEKTVSFTSVRNELVLGKPTDIQAFSKIKKVIDTGECYYIAFKGNDLHSSFIACKDLLVEGTLEEFEEIFSDKIVKETIKHK